MRPISSRIERGILLGLTWLKDNPASLSDIASLADEAWFFRMLLSRYNGTAVACAESWKDDLDARLHAALSIELTSALSSRRGRDASVWCQEAMGALMLAHLLRVSRMKSLDAEKFICVVQQHFERNGDQLFSVSPLINFCFAYNFEQMEISVPKTLSLTMDFSKIEGVGRFITECYYHTHVILFATQTLSREIEDLGPLTESLNFVMIHSPAIIRRRWFDLCAEFALCLSLCGKRDSSFRSLINSLVEGQSPEGCWPHPWYDDRQGRHSTMMSILALLESTYDAGSRP